MTYLFNLDKRKFRQTILTQNGSDQVPFFVSLFLNIRKLNESGKVKKNNINHARRFTDVVRFINDLNVFNDSGYLEKSLQETCLSEVVRKNQQFSKNKGLFLDLIIHKFVTIYLNLFIKIDWD